MFSKLKYSVLSKIEGDSVPKTKFKYCRPSFIGLESDDEVQVSSDTIARPILVPRDLDKLRWNSGYAEVVNAGKSSKNEDQAAIYSTVLKVYYSKRSIFNKLMDMDPVLSHHFYKNLRQTNFVKNRPESIDNSNVNNLEDTTKNLTLDDKNIKENILNNIETSVPPIYVNPNHFDLNSSSNLTRSKSFKETSSDQSRNTLEKSNSFNDIFKNSQDLEGMKEDSLPFHYFAIFDGHAGHDVSLAASQQLHNIIAYKLQSIVDLLIEFGIDDLTNERLERQNSDEHKQNNTNKVKYSKNYLNSTSQPSIYDYALNDSANLISYMNGFNKKQEFKTNGSDENPINSSLNGTKQSESNFANIQQTQKPNKKKLITVDSLIIGALESAFWEMDLIIANDKKNYKMNGGCTVLVAIFILGKLYVANAGDSRATLIKNKQVVPMSFDFTPESERERIKYLGLLKPELLGNEFTALEFIRRPTRNDLGKKLLCRDGFMSGWVYKIVKTEDLKYPLVCGEGKKSRVLATIGVTRGFGDHELRVQNSGVFIKPFLSPEPEIRIINLEKDDDLTENDVLIMATDGLWDITSNEKAAEICTKTFHHFPVEKKDLESENKFNELNYKYRYISAAQDLVMYARGKPKHYNGKNWKTSDDRQATFDDVSVFVIPVKNYRDEYREWKKLRKQKFKNIVNGDSQE